MIASPGAMTLNGITASEVKFCLRSKPHEGVGGWEPRPRNERFASSRMANAMEMVADTISGARQFGRICRKSRRKSEADSDWIQIDGFSLDGDFQSASPLGGMGVGYGVECEQRESDRSLFLIRLSIRLALPYER